jgi:arylsulfatase A-like enzyme
VLKGGILSRALAAVLLLVLAGCARDYPAVDLVTAKSRLLDASVAGRGKPWFAAQAAKLNVRIDDEIRRALPAAPPSRIVYGVDIPSGGHLSFACAVDPSVQDRLAVEFVVKVKRGEREEKVWSQLVDPVARPEHRGWLPADVDLSAYAGRGAQLVLETASPKPLDLARAALWGSPVLSSRQGEAPIAIVYLIDTLRADHTSVYGYSRDTTPELQRFARDAVVFDAAIAHSSWTKPSIASMLSALLPASHGAVHLRDTFAGRNFTIGERLQAKGFLTAAFTANPVIYERGSNFEQGFDLFQGIHDPEGRASNHALARDVVDAAVRWLDARRGLPGFLFVHTMDPHVPYAPPPPFDMKYEPHPGPDHPGQDPRDEDKKSVSDRDYYVAQYDGEIAYGDQQFGRFLSALKARGLYDRAILVFMADHGEEFADHGHWTHGTSLYDELVRIPLIVKFPGRRGAGRRVPAQVQEVDVLPTLLQALALPAPGEPEIRGRPLQTLLEEKTDPRPAVMELSHRGVVAHGIRTEHDKYVRSFSPVSEELYFSLDEDPAEKQNRVAQARERVRSLRAAVEPSLLPNPFRHTLRLTGAGAYHLTVRTGGWIENVETIGFSPKEPTVLDASKSVLEIVAHPDAGHARELSFVIRPRGTRVWLEGVFNARPLQPQQLFLGEQQLHPQQLPAVLPDLDDGAGLKPFAPRDTKQAGLYVWLALAPGREVMDLDEGARERLRALGYIGTVQR